MTLKGQTRDSNTLKA